MTDSNATAPASSSGNPAATTSKIRTLRLRVTTGNGPHPPCTLLTNQRPVQRCSVNRSGYAAIPPSSTIAVATTNPGVMPTTRSDTTRGWRRRSTGVICACSRDS